jgi:glucosamine--fructose-6-phosphate aminotransferase (isomerizing)
MCGIVGYVGHRQAVDFLLEGLHRLEYRGYDSSGVVTITSSGKFCLVKTAGRIDLLEQKLADTAAEGAIGIGHTRWATHGAPNDQNAHPHVGGEQVLAVVHNGVIENFRALKEELESEGYIFRSATDSEIIGHLIARCLERQPETNSGAAKSDDPTERYAPLLRAVQEALVQLRGTYGLAILFREHPDVLIAARLGSPLVVGVGEGEHFIASDASPLVGHTKQIVYLADHEVAVVTADSLRVIHRDQGDIKHRVRDLEIDTTAVDLNGYPHYMLKEIFEQPESLENAMRGRLDREEATAVFGGLNLTPQHLRQVNRIILTACGTSWHSALVGEYMLEEFARIPVDVEYASELRYRNPPIDRDTLLFAITQSGETADTLAALREVKRKGHPTLAICNVVGSTIAQEADGGIYLHAGPEIGVASTKAFTSQCLTLAMLGLYFGRLRHLSYSAGERIIEQMQQLPDMVRQALECNNHVRQIAGKYAHCGGIGRRAQAERNQLHSRRRLSVGRNEARAHRAGRRTHPQCVHHSARSSVRKGDVEPRRNQSPRRPGHRHHERRRHPRGPAGRRCHPRARRGRFSATHHHRHTVATLGLPHRRATWLRCRQATEPGKERNGRVTVKSRQLEDSKYSQSST